MPILDRMTVFSGVYNPDNSISGQTVTGTNTTIVSTDKMDLLQNRDIGQGAGPVFKFWVTAAFAGLTSLELQIVVADDELLTVNATPLASTGPIPLARLTQNAQFVLELSTRAGFRGRRYIGTRYVIVGTGSAGAIFAGIVAGISDGTKIYPASQSIV